MEQTNDGYAVQEFARRAGISRQWLYLLCKQGRGPRIINVFAPDKRGRVATRRGRVVIPKAEGDQWLAKRQSH